MTRPDENSGTVTIETGAAPGAQWYLPLSFRQLRSRDMDFEPAGRHAPGCFSLVCRRSDIGISRVKENHKQGMLGVGVWLGCHHLLCQTYKMNNNGIGRCLRENLSLLTATLFKNKQQKQ